MTVAPSLVPRLFLAPVFDRCLQYWIDFECCKSSKLEAKIAGNEASGMNFWCNIASSPGLHHRPVLITYSFCIMHGTRLPENEPIVLFPGLSS